MKQIYKSFINLFILMRVLVLVIVSFDKPEYYDMLQVWKERVRGRSDVWFIQCKPASEWIGDIVNDIGDERSGSPMTPPLSGDTMNDILNTQFQQLLGSQSLCDRFELDVLNKTLFIRGDECLIPGILYKTVEALSYFLSFDYDFVWRTNLSSVLDFEGLQRYLGTINSSGFYGGYVGKALSVGENIFFASGAGFLMSRDVAEYLVLNKDSLRWDLIDDVAIGALLEPRYGIVPIERCWIQSGEEVVGGNGVFHYRCESYQHLRTVEFMQYVVRGLSK